jgi:nucleotide-binding universal stress UspA family protein
MTEPETAPPTAEQPTEPGTREPERVFLVVVDETDEMANALRFACRRAQHTEGRVALLYVIEPPEFQHWLGVERVMQDEAREQAEQTLQTLAGRVYGQRPILLIREGRRHEELLAVLEKSEPQVSVLVLATAAGRQDPGPLVTHLVGKMGGHLRVPVTLVPGILAEEEIDRLT